MGYTTNFTGAINLSRKLTMAEAKELLEIADDGESKKVTGIDAYFQWVPSCDLQHIVWDGNEKFYKYKEQMAWLCRWLLVRGIVANGDLHWQGEEVGDTGTITVYSNEVTSHANDKSAGEKHRPMTLSDLQKMALEQVVTAE